MNKKRDFLMGRTSENRRLIDGLSGDLLFLRSRVGKIESDIAELIRHEAEGLFMPNEIWWEKKIFLAANPATAPIDYTTFSDYLVKKFKATDAELGEWTLLTAITQS